MEHFDSGQNRHGVFFGEGGVDEFPDPPAKITGIIDEGTNEDKQTNFEAIDQNEATKMANGAGRNSLLVANSEGDILDEPDQVVGIINDPDDAAADYESDGGSRRDEAVDEETRETVTRLSDSEYLPDEANPDEANPDEAGVVEEGTIEERPPDADDSIPENEQSSAIAVDGEGVNSTATNEAIDGREADGLADERASLSSSADPVPIDVIAEAVDPTQPDDTERPVTGVVSPQIDDQSKMSQAENGAIQSMSDQHKAPTTTISKAGYVDPEDPKYWFSAKSPMNMDCYFAFACISCVINVLIGSVALYLVQKGRDSSTAAEAKKFGCYSIIVGFMAILVTATIIALVIVLAR